jgi:hypothetical protein
MLATENHDEVSLDLSIEGKQAHMRTKDVESTKSYHDAAHDGFCTRYSGPQLCYTSAILKRI